MHPTFLWSTTPYRRWASVGPCLLDPLLYDAITGGLPTVFSLEVAVRNVVCTVCTDSQYVLVPGYIGQEYNWIYEKPSMSQLLYSTVITRTGTSMPITPTSSPQSPQSRLTVTSPTSNNHISDHVPGGGKLAHLCC